MKTIIRLKLSLLFVLIIILSACSLQISQTDNAITPTVGLITATLPPTLTPRASSTPLPATAIPTVEPVPGTTTAQVNVRLRPSTASESVGLLELGAEVQIIGKDANEAWYQIYFVFPSGARGEGWTAAKYVHTGSKPDVPVTTGGSDPNSEGLTAQVTQQINVRNGPGTNFEALGMLNVNDVVTLSGKNSSGTWLQIEYASGDGGKGWVSAAYVQTDEADALPIIGDAGEALGTATPTDIPVTLTPTVVPAPSDNDTSESPAINIMFSTTEARSFSYSSDVSSPEGDAEDWISFRASNPQSEVVTLYLDLECSGNGTLLVELWQGNEKMTRWGNLTCGDDDYELVLFRNATYQFRMRAKSAKALEYIKYTLTVQAGQ